MIQPGTGGRLLVQQASYDPFVLDIGSTETLNAVDGTTIGNLVGVSDLNTINLVGGGVDNVTPSPNVTINIDGGTPPFLNAYTGTLNVATAGTTNPHLQVSVGYGLGLIGPDYAHPYVFGTYSFADRMPINFNNIANVTPSASDTSIATYAMGPVNAGSQVTYTVVVFNTNPTLPVGLAEPGITVTDLFPALLSGVTYTSVVTGGATGNTASGTGNLNDTVNLPIGSMITYTVTGTLAASRDGHAEQHGYRDSARQ